MVAQLELESQPEFQLVPIHNTGNTFLDIYNIVVDSFCPYRGITLDQPAIRDRAQLDDAKRYVNFVRINGRDRTDQPVVICILDRNESNGNEIVTVTEKFKGFLINIKTTGDIIVIAPCAFATHVLNYITTLSSTLKLYRHHWDQFKTVLPLGPFCSSMIALTDAQATSELRMFNIDRSEMKKMFVNDPQNVWLGAKPGTIVRIRRTIPGTGYGTDYRYVIAAKR